MVRSKRLAGTAVLLIGLGLGAASCADDGGYVAYGAYPYYGFYGPSVGIFYGGYWGGGFGHRGFGRGGFRR